MAASQVEHASAPKAPARAPRHLPGFEQLFARYAIGFAQRASDARKQCVTRKAVQIVAREAGTAAGVEAHAPNVDRFAVEDARGLTA